MRQVRGWLGLVAPLAIVAILTAATTLGSTAGVGAQSRSIDLYHAERFDWYFFYDADQWQIEEQTWEPGSDDVRFSNGDTVVYYSTFDAAGMTPEDCVGNVLTSLNNDPSVVDVTALSDEPGPPEIIGGQPSAYTPLVVTVDAGDGPFKLAAVETCASFDDGRTLVFRSINVPAASYNEHPRQFDSPEIVSSVDFGDLGEVRVVPTPEPVGTDNGGGTGSLAVRLECESPGPYYVIAQGLSGHIVIQPDNFVAHVVDSGQIEAVSIEWLYPANPSSAELSLRPGELALFQLVVAPRDQSGVQDFDLQYVASGAKPVSLGTSSGPCPGAGGGLPNTIDIELPA
jgi:hypothetical protein